MKRKIQFLLSMAIIMVASSTFAQLPTLSKSERDVLHQYFTSDSSYAAPDSNASIRAIEFKEFQKRVVKAIRAFGNPNEDVRQILVGLFMAAGYSESRALEMAKTAMSSNNYGVFINEMTGLVHVDTHGWDNVVKNDTLFQAFVKKTDDAFKLATTMRDTTLPAMRTDITTLGNRQNDMDRELGTVTALYLERHGPKQFNMPKKNREQAESSLASFYRARAARAASKTK